MSDFDYTRSTSNDFVNTIKILTFDFSFLREFAERYQISGQTIQKIEDTGGNAPTPGLNEDQQSPGRERQVRQIPRLNIPLTSSIIRRSNKLEGMPEQTQLTNENKIKIRFRQVFISFEHVYNRENLTNEKYGYHEIYGKITRAFNIL
jgi:hypothetical protein